MYAILLALAPAAPAPGDAVFVVAGPEDDRPTGKLLRLTPDFTATLATRIGETTVKDVISLRRPNRTLPPFPTGPHLVTATGERLVGEVLGGVGQSLRFAPAAVPIKRDEGWLVPLSSLAAVWLADTPADTPPDPARYAWTVGNRNRDVFRYRDGDTARGILAGFAPAADGPGFQFRPDSAAARVVPAGELAAVAVNPILVKPRKPKGPYARVILTDGSRLDLSGPAVADGVLSGETLFGQKTALPLDAVVSLDVYQGKAAYLSDLKPKKVEQSGFLGTAWPWVADRTVNGTPLRLATGGEASTFDKGLGTHPRTVLTYDLAGKYRRFEAGVGLDPSSGDRGRAVVRVKVDGKEQPLPKLAPLAAGDPVDVRVDVTGAKELSLVVDFGPAGGVRADVNWAEARVVE